MADEKEAQLTPLNEANEHRNVRAYSRIFRKCLEEARLVEPVDAAVQLKIATTLFERYYQDQVRLALEAKKWQAVEPFIDDIKKLLERTGRF
jgi:hypothetical protein